MLLWKEKTIIKLTLRVWWLNVVNHLSKEEMPVRKLNLWVKKRDLIYILQLRKNVSNYVKQRRKNKFSFSFTSRLQDLPKLDFYQSAALFTKSV